MATIERRGLVGGGCEGEWWVRWRECGRGDSWESVAFGSALAARRFEALVELNDDRWPSQEELYRYGFDDIVADRRAATDKRAAGESSVTEVTFAQYARMFMDGPVKPSAETKRCYWRRLEVHVFPIFGDRPVTSLTRRSEWRAWQTGLQDAGLAPKSIANLRGETLIPILEAACLPGEDGEPPLLAHNPLRGLPLPPRHPVDKDIIDTPEEAALFVELAYQGDPNAADLLVTKLAGGFRWGEIAGIPVRAVHAARGTVAVRQVLVRDQGCWRIRPTPKTANGWREIPLPGQVMDLLARHCHGRNRDDLVFVGPTGRSWRYSYFYRTRWTPIRDAFHARTGKHLQPHGLRHSMLTLLAASNLDLATLRYVAGHKTIHTTYNLYVHASRAHHTAITTATGTFLTRLSTAPASEPMRFALDGIDYEIRLTDHDAAALREMLAPFVAAARPFGTTGPTSAGH